jgi:hypothetical protein
MAEGNVDGAPNLDKGMASREAFVRQFGDGLNEKAQEGQPTLTIGKTTEEFGELNQQGETATVTSTPTLEASTLTEQEATVQQAPVISETPAATPSSSAAPDIAVPAVPVVESAAKTEEVDSVTDKNQPPVDTKASFVVPSASTTPEAVEGPMAQATLEAHAEEAVRPAESFEDVQKVLEEKLKDTSPKDQAKVVRESYKNRLKYEVKLGGILLDTDIIKNEKGEVVNKIRPFFFNKKEGLTNDFLKEQLREKLNKPADIVAETTENVANLGTVQDKIKQKISEAEAAVKAEKDLAKQLNLNFVKGELDKADKGEPNNVGIITPELVNFLKDNNISDDEIREMTTEVKWSKAKELLKSKPEDAIRKPGDVVAATVKNVSESGAKLNQEEQAISEAQAAVGAPEDKIAAAEKTFKEADKSWREAYRPLDEALDSYEPFITASRVLKEAKKQNPNNKEDLDKLLENSQKAELAFYSTPLGSELYGKQYPFFQARKEAENALNQLKTTPVSS